MTYAYQFMQSAIVGAEIYGLITMKTELDQFDNAYNSLKDMNTYSYDSIEYYFAGKFNDLFFGGSTICSGNHKRIN